MSRIHEAVKKAEQERAAGIPTEMAPRPAEPRFESTPVGNNGNVPADYATRSGILAPVTTTEYLRFDDLRARCAHPRWQPDRNVNIFLNSEDEGPAAEQFRTLRSRLYQIRGNQPLHKLLVTSAVAAEGKTFVTNNLGHAIVRQPDRRVLLIDADLRCPRLHVPLGAPLSPGLTDYLRGEADEMSVIQHGQDGNLCLIAGGNQVTNPSELLQNGRLKVLIERLTPVFDWVILDSPPCLPVADATLLADLCDGVLLVVRAASTPSELAHRACQELQGKSIAGVVLNAVEEGPAYGAYYYGQYVNRSGATA